MKTKSQPRFVRLNDLLPITFASLLTTLMVFGAALLNGCIYEEPPPREVVVQPGTTVVEGGYPVGSEVVADQAPPDPIVEVVPASPGVDFIWIPGVWIWQGRWVWTRGHWDRPPRAGMIWAPNRYEFRNGAHVFIRGGWVARR
jgi:hypothetical protein